MDHSTCRDQSTLTLKSLLDRVVRLLDIDTLEVRDSLGELTVGVDWDWRFARLDQTVLHARLVIILTKAWGAVHNTSTSVRCDEVSTNDSEALLLLEMLEVLEQRHIALTN